MYKIKLIPSITIIFSLMAGIAFADAKPQKYDPSSNEAFRAFIKLPKHYPSNLKTVGKITEVLKKTKVIVLDGAAYKLHPLHDIYTTKKGRQATLYNLKPGMIVGLEFTTYQGKRAAYKVWILPKNYPPTLHAH